eukprot:Nk52_evm1s276 gene=Nk52_evmTU1s276
MVKAKVFVTGGGGFVGRNLIKQLIADGYEVVAMTRSEGSKSTVEKLGAKNVHGDLSSVEELASAMKGCDAVFHIAALASLDGPWEIFERDNIVATENVVNGALKAGVRRLIHCSTEAVLCGENPIINADETAPYPNYPYGPYPKSKMISEQNVLEANGKNGIETLAVRPRIVWGKDDSNILPRLCDAVRTGEFKYINGGNYLTSTCHIDNLVEGMMKAYGKGKAGEVYFLTDGEPIEFRDFVVQMLATHGVDASKCWSIPSSLGYFLGWVGFIPKTYVRLWGEEVTVVDAKARREIGYQGKVTIAEGIKELKRLAQ